MKFEILTLATILTATACATTMPAPATNPAAQVLEDHTRIKLAKTLASADNILTEVVDRMIWYDQHMPIYIMYFCGMSDYDCRFSALVSEIKIMSDLGLEAKDQEGFNVVEARIRRFIHELNDMVVHFPNERKKMGSFWDRAERILTAVGERRMKTVGPKPGSD